jgi:uncharacterized membrane protein YkvA (DUF1232 family)
MSRNPPVPVDPERLERDQSTVRTGFWAKIRATVGRVPFLKEAIAAFYCASDPATPLHVKAVLFGALAYFVLPFDAVPDIIAVLGFTDDAAVLFGAIRMVSSHITEEHHAKAQAWLAKLEQGG